MEKKIAMLSISEYGNVFDSDGEIEEFTVNGEMAPIKWYRQGDREYNGKFVIVVKYK